MPIFGLVGVERSGKDTVADYLVKHHGFIKYSMADPIRKIAQHMFHWTHDQVHGPLKDCVDPVTGIKPRDFFVWFGTQVAQFDMHEALPGLAIPSRTIWTHAMLAFLKEHPDANIVIPDIRFLHEARALQEQGGCLLGVRRPDKETPEQLAKYDLEALFKTGLHEFHNTGALPELLYALDTYLCQRHGYATSYAFDTSNVSMFI